MMRRPDIPLTVLGGFLGAGKTSLLNHLLRTQQAERVLVMVNDFGAINIDAELIAKAAPGMPEGIVSLTNGCVCCSVGGDLMQAFLKVLKLPEPPGRILVEASGVGDPARIAQLGRAGGGFRSEGVVTVADAEAVRRLARDRYVGDTVRAQLRAADLVLLNKADLVAAAELDALRSWLATQVPDARVIACRHGQVDPRLILGPALGAIDVAAGERAGDVTADTDTDTDHAAAFAGSSFASSIRFRRAALEGALDALPPQVLRGKGMVFLEGEDSPRLLQICGKRWTLERPGPPEAAVRSRIVFIAARQSGGAAFDPWRHFGPALAG
ncbi:CobW C-terminal domain-containing protein [Cupriavidus oxalaticus]|uniref:CobW family GTP-binding protein n=1 Tax=Cupriavidus oxalaticus TaxID=96344 RepID=UPI003F735CAC